VVLLGGVEEEVADEPLAFLLGEGARVQHGIPWPSNAPSRATPARQQACCGTREAMSDTTLLTVRDLARRWKVSASNIYNLVESRKLRCFRIGVGRGAIRFSEDHVREFLESSSRDILSFGEDLPHLR
jgi:excisionase family DNA binding protein